MSQATNRATTNHSDRKTGTVIPMPQDLLLTGAQARTLWELCTLAAYHPSGFTYTPKMEALVEFIADAAGTAGDRAFCLARADQRERAVIARPARRAAA
jgi:hypothetical protein